MKRICHIVAAAVAMAAAVLLPGCRDATFHNVYSSSQERSMGAQAADQVNRSVKLDTDGKDNARVQKIATPIFQQAMKMRSDVQYSIKIIDSPEVNAFSLPGGYVYIYTGLMDKIGDDDDALACVIGHETAHVVRKHAVNQISDSGIKENLLGVFGLATNNYNAYNALEAVNELTQLHYSREDEYEADKYGLMFAYNAGYDPNGMLRMFDKLAEIEKVTGSQPAYAEDHPITKNRELRAAELIKELRADQGAYPDMSTPAAVPPPTAESQSPAPTPTDSGLKQ